jgi:drug/metabolite transporter (DMT)-like permease
VPPENSRKFFHAVVRRKFDENPWIHRLFRSLLSCAVAGGIRRRRSLAPENNFLLGRKSATHGVIPDSLVLPYGFFRKYGGTHTKMLSSFYRVKDVNLEAHMTHEISANQENLAHIAQKAKADHFKAYLALFTTLIFWSSALVAIRFGVQSYNPGSVALLRLLSGSVMITFVLLRKRSHVSLRWKEIAMILWLGFLINAVYQTSLSFGEQSVTAGISAFIISTIPLYSTIGAVFFHREQMSKVGWLGVLISFLGIAFIALGEADNFSLDFGVVYILISAIAASIYILMAKPLLKKIGPLYFTAYTLWAGTLFVLIYSVDLIQDFQAAPFGATLAVIYLGIFPTAIAYITYNHALNYLSTTIATNWLYAIPLLTCVQAWLFLGEIPTITAVLGGCVAIVGTVIVTFYSGRNQNVAPKKSIK